MTEHPQIPGQLDLLEELQRLAEQTERDTLEPIDCADDEAP